MSVKKIMLNRILASSVSTFFNNLYYGENNYDGYSYEITDGQGKVYEIDIAGHEITRRKADTGFDPLVIDRINKELDENNVVDILPAGAVRYHIPVHDDILSGTIAEMYTVLKNGPIPFMAGNKNYVLTPIGSVVGIYNYSNGHRESSTFIIVETDEQKYLSRCNMPVAIPVGTYLGKRIMDVTSFALFDAMEPGQYKKPFNIQWI